MSADMSRAARESDEELPVTSEGLTAVHESIPHRSWIGF